MTLSTFLLFYFGGVVLLLIFGGLVVLNFARYRFQYDRTFFFVGIIAVLFVIVMGSTIALTRASNNGTPPAPAIFQ